jgi:CRP-like cAMP-binding protein
MEKLNAIKLCPSFKTWPRHTVEELMTLFEWRTFQASTVLASEGYRCPFIGFIAQGSCHVLRKVDVPRYNPKLKVVEKHMKQVVIGKLKENESFGEISVALKEPMTCSIVTETVCKIGTIQFDQLDSSSRFFLFF